LKEICENLNGVEYFIFYGTLLGFHRERNIIQNDDDIDLLVNKVFRKEILAILTKLNYKISYDTKSFVSCTKVSGNKKVTRIVDFYFYEHLNDDFLLEKWNFFGHPHNSSTYIHIPKSIVYPIRTETIQGIRCKVPQDVEQCCRFLYGDRFMTPIKKSAYTFKIVDNKPNIIYKI